MRQREAERKVKKVLKSHNHNYEGSFKVTIYREDLIVTVGFIDNVLAGISTDVISALLKEFNADKGFVFFFEGLRPYLDIYLNE